MLGLKQIVNKNARTVKSNIPTAPNTVFCKTLWKVSSFIFFIYMPILMSVRIGNAVMMPDKNRYFDWLNSNANTIMVPPTIKYKIYNICNPRFLIQNSVIILCGIIPYKPLI